jgi:hypothetical protein
MSEQELPVGYQLPNPYANHSANIMWEKFIESNAKLSCNHYPDRTQYYCALCRYEFTEKHIREVSKSE